MIRMNQVIQAIRQFAPVRRVNGMYGDIVIPNITPEPSGNSVIYGDIVSLGNLAIRVSAAQFVLQGATLNSQQTDLAVTTANGSNPRIDVVALTAAGPVIVAGTPAVNPAKPVLDPETQVELSQILVPAAATSLTITNKPMYYENTGTGGGEFTFTSSGTGWTLGSTNNPLQGTKCIEATSVANGAYVVGADSADFDLANYNNVILNLRSKASWANAKSLTVEFLSSTDVRVGAAFTLKNGTLGFSTSNTTAYQQIVIPALTFQANGRACRKIKVTVNGSGGNIGFYLDFVFLQGGLVLTKETTSNFKFIGPYTANKGYAFAEAVLYNETLYQSNFNGNLGNTPSQTSAFWTVVHRNVETWGFACSDFNTTALAAATGVGGFHATYDAIVLGASAGLMTPQAAGATLTCDVKAAGTSIMTTTKLTFANTFDHTSKGSAVQPVLTTTSIPKGTKITGDITAIGDGSAKGLTMYLLVTRA